MAGRVSLPIRVRTRCRGREAGCHVKLPRDLQAADAPIVPSASQNVSKILSSATLEYIGDGRSMADMAVQLQEELTPKDKKPTLGMHSN